MKFSDLPVQVRDALLSKTRGERFAEPRQKWNATDVRDRSLPERRLIFAGTVDGNWFIYYEHGGRGKHVVVLSQNAGGEAPIAANRTTLESLTSLADVKRILAAPEVYPRDEF
jgi:hypothetical protein